MLDVGVGHEGVFGGEGGGLADDPVVLVDVVGVTEHDVQVVVEAEAVHRETVHVHADLEEGLYYDFLVGGEA